jgi:hypothetical protein
MKTLFYFIASCCFVVSVYGQSLKGFYTGQMKVPGQREMMQVQLDLLEEDGGYRGVFRSRFVENNIITGCDNWVEGRMSGKNIVLRNLAITRETGVPEGACNMMRQIRLTPNNKGDVITFSCVWEMEEGEIFGRFNLVREDTAVSYVIEEEREIAYRQMAESLIFRAPTDSLRIGLMLQYRPKAIRDTIIVEADDVEIQITALTADPYHLFTILVNGVPVAIRRAPKQQGLKLKINTREYPEAEIVFLCEHSLVNVYFQIEATISVGDKQKQLTIPVSTYQNAGIYLKTGKEVSE